MRKLKKATLGMALQAVVIGFLGASMAALYCKLFDYAQSLTQRVFAYIGENPKAAFLWFAFLLLAAFLVYLLHKWEPMISGGGITMVESELHGVSSHTPFRLVIAKFVGGFITALCGLSLGRAGASVQVSAMTGIGVSKLLRHSDDDRQIFLACGAAAGFAAAFHAPLAGFFFAYELLRKCMPKDGFLPCMCATAASGLAVKYLFGSPRIFELTPAKVIPPKAFIAFTILAVVIGMFGAFYNKFSLVTYKIGAKIEKMKVRLVIAFLLAGVVGLFLPQVLGSGQSLVNKVALGKMGVPLLLAILICKFLFSMVCVGSGAPGGIFMPMFGMCSAIGAIACAMAVRFLGVDPSLLHSFIGLSIVAGFAGVARAPITAILLLFEGTSAVWSMPSVILVCVISYIVSESLHEMSIGEQQLRKLHGNLFVDI